MYLGGRVRVLYTGCFRGLRQLAARLTRPISALVMLFFFFFIYRAVQRVYFNREKYRLVSTKVY